MQLMISLCDGAATKSVITFSQLAATVNFTPPNALIATLRHAYSAIRSGIIHARATWYNYGLITIQEMRIRAKNG